MKCRIVGMQHALSFTGQQNLSNLKFVMMRWTSWMT